MMEQTYGGRIAAAFDHPRHIAFGEPISSRLVVVARDRVHVIPDTNSFHPERSFSLDTGKQIRDDSPTTSLVGMNSSLETARYFLACFLCQPTIILVDKENSKRHRFNLESCIPGFIDDVDHMFETQETVFLLTTTGYLIVLDITTETCRCLYQLALSNPLKVLVFPHAIVPNTIVIVHGGENDKFLVSRINVTTGECKTIGEYSSYPQCTKVGALLVLWVGERLSSINLNDSSVTAQTIYATPADALKRANKLYTVAHGILTIHPDKGFIWFWQWDPLIGEWSKVNSFPYFISNNEHVNAVASHFFITKVAQEPFNEKGETLYVYNIILGRMVYRIVTPGRCVTTIRQVENVVTIDFSNYEYLSPGVSIVSWQEDKGPRAPCIELMLRARAQAHRAKEPPKAIKGEDFVPPPSAKILRWGFPEGEKATRPAAATPYASVS